MGQNVRDRYRQLTLVDLQESGGELAGEDRLGQVSEILLQQVSHIVGRLALIADIVGRGLIHLAQVLDPRLHPRLAEDAHLAHADQGGRGTWRGRL